MDGIGGDSNSKDVCNELSCDHIKYLIVLSIGNDIKWLTASLKVMCMHA